MKIDSLMEIVDQPGFSELGFIVDDVMQLWIDSEPFYLLQVPFHYLQKYPTSLKQGKSAFEAINF